MTPVAVVSDTTHYLPRELADRREIHQVSLYVGWDGELEREIEMHSFERFYERLGTDPQLPSTSQPSIGDFLAVWEPLVEAGMDIVSIHLASGLSGTCDAARQARELLERRGLGGRIEAISRRRDATVSAVGTRHRQSTLYAPRSTFIRALYGTGARKNPGPI